jgi:hypothetical protein
MVEMTAIAAAILGRARLRPAHAAAERQILEGITLVPERGAEVILEAPR